LARDINDAYYFSFAFKGDWRLRIVDKKLNTYMTRVDVKGQTEVKSANVDDEEKALTKYLSDVFEGLVDQSVYSVEVEEDAEIMKQEAAQRQRDPSSYGIQRATKEDHALMRGGGSKVRQDELTNQLKAMSKEELLEKGDKYKQLLEERELENILFN
jgi:hypothetical protein